MGRPLEPKTLQAGERSFTRATAPTQLNIHEGLHALTYSRFKRLTSSFHVNTTAPLPATLSTKTRTGLPRPSSHSCTSCSPQQGPCAHTALVHGSYGTYKPTMPSPNNNRCPGWCGTGPATQPCFHCLRNVLCVAQSIRSSHPWPLSYEEVKVTEASTVSGYSMLGVHTVAAPWRTSPSKVCPVG